jgi:hypothetical protein
MPRKKKDPAEDAITRAIEGAVAIDGPAVVEPTPEVAGAIRAEPEPGDPGWQDYVMGHFDPARDFDPDGNPFAESCRVVAEKILGPVVSERVEVAQAPNAANGYRATVVVTVGIAWGGDRNDVRFFGDVADIYPGNAEPQFARHASASAKTRALGRAYKSALKLRKVYASEEMARVPVSEAGLDGRIVPSQVDFIDMQCRAHDIDVLKFINSGSGRYDAISQVKYEKACLMEEKLSEYERDRSSIPEKVRGYDPNWKKG